MSIVDEVTVNTLIADGVDAPTAYAASIDDTAPQPASDNYRRSFDLGLLAGLVLFILWQFI